MYIKPQKRRRSWGRHTFSKRHDKTSLSLTTTKNVQNTIFMRVPDRQMKSKQEKNSYAFYWDELWFISTPTSPFRALSDLRWSSHDWKTGELARAAQHVRISSRNTLLQVVKSLISQNLDSLIGFIDQQGRLGGYKKPIPEWSTAASRALTQKGSA